MKCLICGSGNFLHIHKGTRDVADINVMKCAKCGTVQLDTKEYNTEQNYMEGGMLKNSYGMIGDKVDDMTWDTWILETKPDDDRRYDALRNVCSGKRVLEFGCGNGGFLRRIRNEASAVAGVELMDDSRKNMEKEKISVYKTLNTVDEKYDIVCMFMVIEHLNTPDEVLRKIYDVLVPGG